MVEIINEEQRIRARLGICEWLRLLMRSKGFGLEKVGVNAWKDC